MQTDCHRIAYSLSQLAPVSTTISAIGSMIHLVASCLYSDNIPILKERLPNVILQPQQLFCRSVKKFLIFCFKSMSFAELSQSLHNIAIANLSPLPLYQHLTHKATDRKLTQTCFRSSKQPFQWDHKFIARGRNNVDCPASVFSNSWRPFTFFVYGLNKTAEIKTLGFRSILKQQLAITGIKRLVINLLCSSRLFASSRGELSYGCIRRYVIVFCQLKLGDPGTD